MKARTRMIRAKISKRNWTMARSGAWRRRNAGETARPTTPMATMDDRMSLISRATIEPRIMKPSRKMSQVSIGMRSSISQTQYHESQKPEDDEQKVEREKSGVGLLQAMGDAERRPGAKIVDVETL